MEIEHVIWGALGILLVGAMLLSYKLPVRRPTRSSGEDSPPTPSGPAEPEPHELRSLEDKLKVLAANGLSQAQPFTVDDLLSSWGREEYEAPGYVSLLVSLGMTEEEPPWRNRCVNLWHFDTECIYDNGDYATIARRLAEMTQGSLRLEDLADHVDVEAGEAWIAFSVGGKRFKIDCEVDDDWVDMAVFSRFVEILADVDHDLVYVYHDLGGQDVLIGCVTRDQLKNLQTEGIEFRPQK